MDKNKLHNLPPEMILEIGSHLRTCKEISLYCLANKEKMCPINFMKGLIVKKNKNINVDGMIYSLLCKIVEDSSKSNLGEYKNGKGMYQDIFDKLKNENEVLNDMVEFSDILKTEKLKDPRILSKEEILNIMTLLDTIQDSLTVGSLYSKELLKHQVYNKMKKLNGLLYDINEKLTYITAQEEFTKELEEVQRGESLREVFEGEDPIEDIQRELRYVSERLEKLDKNIKGYMDNYKKEIYEFLKDNFESFIDTVIRNKKRDEKNGDKILLNYIYKS